MKKISIEERPDWRETAEREGFNFHTIDGERYWDERATTSSPKNRSPGTSKHRPKSFMQCVWMWWSGWLKARNC